MTYQDEELGYNSSAENIRPSVDIVQQDEADLPVLRAVLRDIDEGIVHHQSIASLNLESKVLTVKQQITVNQAIVTYLSNFKLGIENTMDQIKEKYNG